MRRKSFQIGVSWRLITALVLVLNLLMIPANPAFAQDLSGYFSIDYDIEFSKTQIEVSETFYVTIIATATCTNDLPVTPSEAEITGRIVATHQESGDKVTLNTSYTITIEPFPGQVGDVTQTSKTVTLQFPSGSESGTYSVVGKLIEAKVKAVIWIPVTSFLPSSKTMGSVTYESDSSGGGISGVGGVGGQAGFTSLLDSITEAGRITEDITAKSGDRNVQLFIPKGTISKNRAGSFLTGIRIKEALDGPTIPVNSKTIGLIYDIQPSGATFNPPVTLTLKYDTSKIPGGVSEKNLIVATWDTSGDKWVELESAVQTKSAIVSANISHLSLYTIMAHTQPASFTASHLSITPAEVNSGESLSISVIVTNSGDLTDSYEVSLKIDDVVVQTKNIMLGGGGSQTVSFSVTPSTAGERTTKINGLLGTFKVKTPTIPPATEPAQPPATEPIQPPATEPIPAPTNWPLIGGIVGGAIVVGLLILLLARRRVD